MMDDDFYSAEVRFTDGSRGVVIHMTEQRRLDAIAACERIQELCEQQQQSLGRIVEIFERLSKPTRMTHCPDCGAKLGEGAIASCDRRDCINYTPAVQAS